MLPRRLNTYKKRRFAALLQSPLTDSNRRPPRYHRRSAGRDQLRVHPLPPAQPLAIEVEADQRRLLERAHRRLTVIENTAWRALALESRAEELTLVRPSM